MLLKNILKKTLSLSLSLSLSRIYFQFSSTFANYMEKEKQVYDSKQSSNIQ